MYHCDTADHGPKHICGRQISLAALCRREWPAQIHAPAVKQPFNKERVQLQRLSVERRLDALIHFTPADHLLSRKHDARPPVIDEYKMGGAPDAKVAAGQMRTFYNPWTLTRWWHYTRSAIGHAPQNDNLAGCPLLGGHRDSAVPRAPQNALSHSWCVPCV